MPADPAVSIPGSGPDEAIAPVRSPGRRRRFALRRPADGAARMLHLLLIGSILAPALVLLGGGYLGYQRTFEGAQADLAQDTAVAEENVIKVLDTHEIVAARVGDLLAGLSDEEIRAREQGVSRPHQAADRASATGRARLGGRPPRPPAGTRA